MRYTFGKRVLALGLSAAMLLGMTACGNQSDSSAEAENSAAASGGTNTTLADTLGYGYTSEYTELNLDMEWVNNCAAANGKLYAMGSVYNEETLESDNVIVEISTADGSTTPVPMPELEKDEETSSYITSFSVAQDGQSYWIFADQTTWGSMDDYVVNEDSSMEEDAEIYDDGEYMSDYSEEFLAIKCDMQGNILREINLSEAIGADLDEDTYLYVSSAAEDAQGSLYIYTGDSIMKFDGDGNYTGTVELDAVYVESLTATGNGTIVLAYYTESGGECLAMLNDDGTATDIDISAVSSMYSSIYLYAGSGDTILLSNGTELYSVDVKAGTTTELLNWLDSDINCNNLTAVTNGADDQIFVLLGKYLSKQETYSYELGSMTKTPVEELPQRTVITLGCVYTDSNVQDAIVDFNRTNGTYRISVVDYSKYATEDDYEAAYDQLDKDIISGTAPDIISLDDGHCARYVSKGALASLTELIDNDSDFSMDLLMSGPMKAYTIDGTLYGMPTSFFAQTLIASEKYTGDISSWTAEDIGKYAEQLDDDAVVMTDYASNTSVLSMLVEANLENFVDFGKATCDFDNDTFKGMLKAASYQPAEEDIDYEDDAEWVEAAVQLQNGSALMSTQYLGDAYSVKSMYNVYSGQYGIVTVGYPTTEGSGAVIYASSTYGISAGSANKDGAWAFIKTMLTDEYQEETWSLPVTVSAFKDVMAETMEPSYYLDENGEKQYYDDTVYIGDTEYPCDPLTQEQVDAFTDYVNNGTVCSYDDDIMEIIQEEAAAYFSGDKTADEVASLIQNRVSIYLGENS